MIGTVGMPRFIGTAPASFIEPRLSVMARSPQIHRERRQMHQPKRLTLAVALQVPGADGGVPIGRAFVLGVVDQRDAAAFRHQPRPPPGGCQQLTAQPCPAIDPSAASALGERLADRGAQAPVSCAPARLHDQGTTARSNRIRDPTGPRRFGRTISLGGVLFMALAYIAGEEDIQVGGAAIELAAIVRL